MQAVADRVLADLGLAEHQALIVAHRDRAHPHVHIMVNRVHPEQQRTATKAEHGVEAAHCEAENLVSRAAEQLCRLQQQLEHVPTLGLLERSIGCAVDRLLPRELAQLRRVITAPQAVIAFTAREAVKDIAQGDGVSALRIPDRTGCAGAATSSNH